jgi:hypothetical protein
MQSKFSFTAVEMLCEVNIKSKYEVNIRFLFQVEPVMKVRGTANKMWW